jgi:signal transduction histidine kinase
VTSNIDLIFIRNSVLPALLLLLSISCAWAQNRKIDSLTAAVLQVSEEKVRADLQHALAEEFFSHDFEKGLVYARKSLALATKIGYPRGRAQALTAIGNYHYFVGDNPAAYTAYREALGAIKGTTTEDYPAKTYLRISILYRQQGYFDSAQHYLKRVRRLLPPDKAGGLQASFWASSGVLAQKQSRKQQALTALRQSLHIRSALKDSSRQADTWRLLGGVYGGLSQFDSADYCFDKAQQLLRKGTDPEVELLLHMSRGETYYLRGAYDKAIDEYTRAMDQLKINTYRRHYAYLLYKIGEIYEKQGAYPLAFDYFFVALKEFEKINARQDMALAYTQIGWSYAYQENYPLALENGYKSLTLAEAIGDSASIAQNKNLIGYTALQQGNLTDARQSLEEALAIRIRIKNWWGTTYTLYNLGLVHKKLGDRGKALQLLNQALETSQRIDHKSAFVFINNALGEFYTESSEYANAAYYLEQARDMAQKIALPTQLLVTYKHYIALYDQQQDAPNTIYFFKAYISLSDSLNSRMNTSRMAKADALFQLQEKAAEIQLVTTEKELQRQKIAVQEAEIGFQRNIIGLVSVGGVLLLLLLVVIYVLYRQNSRAKRVLKRQYEEIQEQQEEILTQSDELIETNSKLAYLNEALNKKNREIEQQSDKLLLANNNLERVVNERTMQLQTAYKELETFFYRTSHDFRRPLTTYLGLVEVANHLVKDKQAIHLFDKVRETTLALDKMLLKLQSISSQELELDEQLSLHELLAVCEQKFTPALQEKGIRLFISCDDCLVSFSHPLLLTVLENLLENAIAFSGNDAPYIRLYAGQTHSEELLLRIEDNGQGIPEHIQPRIFEMYYRGSIHSQGNGLGLYMTRRAVEKLGGTIHCNSRLHEGTTFTVRLPITEPVPLQQGNTWGD